MYHPKDAQENNAVYEEPLTPMIFIYYRVCY